MAAQLQSTELDPIALNEQSLDALHYREMLFLGVDFAEAPTLPDAKSLTPEKLKQVQTAMVRFILQDGDRGYKGRIDQIEFDNGDPLKGVFSDGRTKPAKVFRYEIDGDRKVFSPASGFDFSEEPTLDFGGNKAFKKQPVCDKGWGPCGYRCLSREVKNCPSALEGQAKAYHEWLKTSPKAEDKGTLVGQAKASEEKTGPKKPDNRTDEEWAIDQKYASPDPTDADIDGWRSEIAIAASK